jgi:hypothetical protein
MPTRRRISVSALRPICSIVASTSRVVPLSGVERAPLGAGLDDHHRDVCGRSRRAAPVAILARSSTTASRAATSRSALGELRAPLAIDDHAADEQHHDSVITVKGTLLLQRPRRPRRPRRDC